MPIKAPTFIVFALLVLQLSPLAQTDLHRSNRDGVPRTIPQGPLEVQALSSDPANHYWFQTGAMGYSSNWNHVGASVMIRTVHDNVNLDAHSYWVGGFISNGAFVQVGYLNEITTTNQPYCCAWFYEYFPAGSTRCCDPVIGPEGSAGPIDSWHNYTMAHTQNGIWSFYMDGQKLGSSQPLGATNSGTYAPAAIAEVAGATSNADILGPAEFRDLCVRTSGPGCQPVQTAGEFLWYGKNSTTPTPANPYWVVEVNRRDNNFLVGSYLSQPPNTVASQSPGTQLWPATSGSNAIRMMFVDKENSTFSPAWVSLRDTSGSRAYYTTYNNEAIDADTWTVEKVFWHSTDVTTSESFSIPGPQTVALHENVFSVKVRLIGMVFGLPVSGAITSTTLPDSLSISAKTNASGVAVLKQLPASRYVFTVHPPYGIAASFNQNMTGQATLTARVFGLLEVATLFLVPILVTVLVIAIMVRQQRALQTASSTAPLATSTTAKCSKCDEPVSPSARFCTNCGAPV